MATVQSSVANFSLTSSYNIGYDLVGMYYYLASNPTTGQISKRYSWSVPAGSTLVSAILTNTTSGDGGSKSIGGVTRADSMNFTSAVQSVWGNGYIDLNYRFTCNANITSPTGPRTETSNFNNGLMTITYTPPTAASLSNVLLDGSAGNPYRAAGAGMTLSWSAANGTNNNISSYSIYYRDNGGAWALYASGITSKSYTVYGHPTAGSNRQFYVVAIAPYGNSGNVTSPVAYAYSAVGIPSNVAISLAEVFPDASLTLSWNAPSGGVGTSVTGYQILENGVVKTTVTGTSYAFSAPAPGTYTYKIVAVANVSGYNSAQSAGAAVTVKQPASAVALDKSTVEMDGMAVIIATITPENAAYTHIVTFALDATRTQAYTLAAGVTTQAFTVPAAWCAGVPNATSGQAACTVQTKNGAIVIGSLSQTFAVIVPASILPSVSLAVAPVNGFNGLYLKGRSGAQLSSTAAGVQGSTIVSQALFGGGYSGAASPFVIGVLNTVGTNLMAVTVTDSRSRQMTATQNITVVDYSTPVISLLSAFRSNASGTALETGEYIAVKANLTVAAVSGNSGTATVKKRIAGGTWETAVAITHNTTVILSGALQDNAYELEITLTDTVGTVSTHSLTIRKSSFMFDFRMDRAGIGQLAQGVKSLTLPDDWTTNINADKLDGKHASELWSILMPVGFIYSSLAPTSPATLFGGTWAAIQDRFLVGAGNLYAGNSTGGATTHGHTQVAHAHTTGAMALSTAQMPYHRHVGAYNYTGNFSGSGSYAFMLTTTRVDNGVVGYAGGGAAHGHGDTGGATPAINNGSSMPPYLAVFMWQRTA